MRIIRLEAKQRLATALAVAIATYFAEPAVVSWHTRLIASWDVGTLVYLGLAWTVFGFAPAHPSAGTCSTISRTRSNTGTFSAWPS